MTTQCQSAQSEYRGSMDIDSLFKSKNEPFVVGWLTTKMNGKQLEEFNF
jgi:hypothetical protein